MEPLTTTALISSVVGYLAKSFSDSKAVKDFFNDLSEGVVNWIKPLFLDTDEEPKKELKALQEKPESEARQNAVKSILEMELEDNPEKEKLLQELITAIVAKEARNKAIKISNSKNVNTGNISTGGGNVIIGDDNIYFGNVTSSNISVGKNKLKKQQ